MFSVRVAFFTPVVMKVRVRIRVVGNVAFVGILRTYYMDGPLVGSFMMVIHYNLICSIYQFESVSISSIALGIYICNMMKM